MRLHRKAERSKFPVSFSEGLLIGREVLPYLRKREIGLSVTHRLRCLYHVGYTGKR
jgi:hypothetical protein